MLRYTTIVAMVFLGITAYASPSASEQALAGTWSVSLTANHSSCNTVTVGDIVTMQWIVSITQGQLDVKTVAAHSEDVYSGKIRNGTVRLISKDAGRRVDVELKMDPQGQLFGRRIVVSAGGALDGELCSIIYDVTAKKL